MSKEIRHIDANVQGSKPQVVSASFDSHRPKNTRKDNTACFSGKQNLNQISQLELDPRRLIFDCLSNPAFYLLKVLLIKLCARHRVLYTPLRVREGGAHSKRAGVRTNT